MKANECSDEIGNSVLMHSGGSAGKRIGGFCADVESGSPGA